MSTLNLNVYGEKGAYEPREQDTDTSIGWILYNWKISFPGNSSEDYF